MCNKNIHGINYLCSLCCVFIGSILSSGGFRKELDLIHEFIADEKAIKNSDAETFAKMLLTAQYGKFLFYPAQSIFYSPVKRRLIMLTTSKKPQLSYLRRIMVLPLLACLICLFAFRLNEQKSIITAITLLPKPGLN